MISKQGIRIGFFTKNLGISIGHIRNAIKMFDDEHDICIDEYVVFFFSPTFNKQNYHNIFDFDINVRFVHLKSIKQISTSGVNNMVLINSNHIIEMLIIQFCREKGINSVLLQHGMKIDWEKNKSILAKGNNKSKWFKSGLVKYFYYTKFILNNVFYLAKATRLLSAYFKKVKLIAEKGIIGLSQHYGIHSHKCNFALVYSEMDAQNYCTNYGYLKQEIQVMGYPLGNLDKKQVGWDSYVLVLSAALRKAGVINCSVAEEIRYYQSLIDELLKTDKKLIIKLHPIEDINVFSNLRYDVKRVKIVKDINLVEVVSKSSLVIGDYSTALYNAIFFKKRIIILRNPLLDPYPFDYTAYGIGLKIWMKDLAKTIEGLNYFNLSIKENQNYNTFIKQFIAPANDFSLQKVFCI